nr:uncharacterized protein LOC117280549 [Nicotiana tomentosiformis]
MNGQEIWPKLNNVPPLPPRLERQSTKGRKQKLRKKEPNEVGASRQKMKRKQTKLYFSLCHNPGYNKRTCKLNRVYPYSHDDEMVRQESSFPTASSVHVKLPVRRGPVS